jgi:glycosyl transferase family 25
MRDSQPDADGPRQDVLPGGLAGTAVVAGLKIVSYVINLDRSIDRWHHIRDQANRLGLAVERVAGVDAQKIGPLEQLNYNEKAFVRGNGRPMLPQEHGCYLAHLKALQTFLASDAQCAVIMEDDVELAGDLFDRVKAIHETAPYADVTKLLNHRAVMFRKTAQTTAGDLIGKCAFGPQGSAACYLVTRQGAEQLLIALREISFPFDIALERAWATKVRVYTVKDNVLNLSVRALDSQIADRARYRSIKLRGYKRIPTHIFRVVELVRRVKYSLT